MVEVDQEFAKQMEKSSKLKINQVQVDGLVRIQSAPQYYWKILYLWINQTFLIKKINRFC